MANTDPLPAEHGGFLVLVVDDDDALRDALRDLFEVEGFTVAVAKNGAEALRLLVEHGVEPGAVVCDLAMPVMNGVELTVALRGTERFARTPLVALSASGDGALRAAMAAGAHAALPKPYNVAELVATVRSLLPEASANP
jgi:CheY-like chemotaxis protein